MKTVQQMCILFILAGIFGASGIILKAASAAGFEKELTSGGITFHITSANRGDVNEVRITLLGPGVDSSPVTQTINGTVTWAEVTDDLDNDGSPELYVYATCPDDGSQDNDYTKNPVPSVVTTVTRGHRGTQVGALLPFVHPGTNSSGAAVVIGPGVIRRGNGVAVGVLPVVPVEDQEENICIRELKYILVNGKKGKRLQLVSSK